MDLERDRLIFNRYCQLVFPHSYFLASITGLNEKLQKELDGYGFWCKFMLNKDLTDGLNWIHLLKRRGIIPLVPQTNATREPGGRKIKVIPFWEYKEPTAADIKSQEVARKSQWQKSGRISAENLALQVFGMPGLPGETSGSPTGVAKSFPSPPATSPGDDTIHAVSQELYDWMVWAQAKSKELASMCLREAGKISRSLLPSSKEVAICADPESLRIIPSRKLPSVAGAGTSLPEQARLQTEAKRKVMGWVGLEMFAVFQSSPASYLPLLFALVGDLMVLNGWLDFSYAKSNGEVMPSPAEPRDFAAQKDAVAGLWPAYNRLRDELVAPMRRLRERAEEGPRPETRCNKEAFRASRFYGIVSRERAFQPFQEALWCDVFQDMLALNDEVLSAWVILREKGPEEFAASRLRFFLGREIDRISDRVTRYGRKLRGLDDSDHRFSRALLEALYEDSVDPIDRRRRPTKPRYDPLDGFVAACKEVAAPLIQTYLGDTALRALDPVNEPSSPDSVQWQGAFLTVWQAMAISRRGGDMLDPFVVAGWWRSVHGLRGGIDADEEVFAECEREVEVFGEFLKDTAWVWEVGLWWETLGRNQARYSAIQALGPLYTLGVLIDPRLPSENQGLLGCISPVALTKELETPASLPEKVLAGARWARDVALPVLKDTPQGVHGRTNTLDPAMHALARRYELIGTPDPESLRSDEWTDAKATVLTVLVGSGCCGVTGLDLWTLLLHPVGTHWFWEVGGDLETIGGSILTCYVLTPLHIQRTFDANKEARGHFEGILDKHCIRMVQVLFAETLVTLLTKASLPADLLSVKAATEQVFMSIDDRVGTGATVVPTQAIFRGLELVDPRDIAEKLTTPSEFASFIREIASRTGVARDTCWDAATGPKKRSIE
jgi:hypothetical protein